MPDEPAPQNTAPRRLGKGEREEFLAEPHIGVLSVVSEDERPPSTLPTWYAYEPGRSILVIARQGKRKSRLIRRAGKVSFSVQRPQIPDKYVTVEGTVTRQDVATRDDLLSIGRRYLPADSVDSWADWELRGGNGSGDPECIEIRADRWLTSDFGGPP
ncbi:pyridoxamine 5'-phosphate oxidase family protein [Actinomycetospora sp. NBC_00405]|uniref:pyridoxamine 5'-phosphate oxidase family protein n=1 Tax=Actinomycetospora sp. NBC_00405 TaxID=2975952 RepID=UPI002E2257F3